jgi:hypothetical protein
MSGQHAADLEATIAVAVENQDRLRVRVLRRQPDGPTGSARLAFMGEDQLGAQAAAVPERLLDRLTHDAGGEDDAAQPLVRERQDEPLEEGPAGDLGERLGTVREHRAQPFALPPTEDDRVYHRGRSLRIRSAASGSPLTTA